MSSTTLRKILSYILMSTALFMIVYPALFDFVIHKMIGLTALFYFPIPGHVGEYGEYFPLSEGTRIRLSLISYQFMLAMFATIPLFKIKRFEDTQFYSAYKIFWWFNAPIFSIILTMLVGAANASSSASTIEHIIDFIFIAILSAIILMLTLIPAYFQHKTKQKL